MSLCLKHIHHIAQIKQKGKTAMNMSLKAARVNKGLTQEAAASQLGISKQTLVSYEKYRTIPDVLMAQKIAALYESTIDAISFVK